MQKLYQGDCFDWLPTIGMVDLVIADTPYGEFPTINRMIRECRAICRGPALFFMAVEDLYSLDTKPDDTIFWEKPISTKNTTRKYSEFLEAIAVYDMASGPFNQDMYWANRTGIFRDVLLEKPRHPHEKPVSLYQRLILNHSDPGAVVLDPCCGSGTIFRAARLTERSGIGIEKNPEWLSLSLPCVDIATSGGHAHVPPTLDA